MLCSVLAPSWVFVTELWSTGLVQDWPRIAHQADASLIIARKWRKGQKCRFHMSTKIRLVLTWPLLLCDHQSIPGNTCSFAFHFFPVSFILPTCRSWRIPTLGSSRKTDSRPEIHRISLFFLFRPLFFFFPPKFFLFVLQAAATAIQRL